MKSVVPSLILALLCAMSAEANLVVEVSGVKNEKGFLRVLVFDSADGFPEQRQKAVAMFSVKASEAKEGKISFSIPDWKEKKGVVSILHDEDGDGVPKKGLFGRPKEGVGMSGWNGKSRPSFKSCVKLLSKKVAVTMKYF